MRGCLGRRLQRTDTIIALVSPFGRNVSIGKELSGLVRYDAIDACLRALRAELDHRYLNEEVIGLKESSDHDGEFGAIYLRTRKDDATAASRSFARAR